MSAVKPPKTLGDAGKHAWNTVTSKYELRADELRVLEDACATIDMVAFLTEIWEREGKPILTKGSMGQEVIHPIIGELRAQRAQAARLVAQLKLPDDAEGAP